MTETGVITDASTKNRMKKGNTLLRLNLLPSPPPCFFSFAVR